MNRLQISKLKIEQAKRRAALAELRHKEQVNVLISVKNAITELHDLINGQEKPDFNKLADQLSALNSLVDLKNEFQEVAKSINKKSVDPESFTKLLKAIESNKPIKQEIDIKRLEKAIIAVNQRIQEQTDKEEPQDADEYKPFRRVIRVGNRFVFDDQPTPSRGGGGSSGGSSSGGLTDTELRATPVPVSGTVTVNEPVTVDATDLDIRNLDSTTDSVTVVGNVGAGGTDSGNPVKIGAVVNTTPPTLSAGQRTDLQTGTRGSLRVALYTDNTSTAIKGLGETSDGVTASATANNLSTIARNTVFNGSTWDRMPGDTTGLKIQDGGNSITVDGTVAATQSGTWTEANSASIKTSVELIDDAVYNGDAPNSKYVGVAAQYDDVAPSTVTENNVRALRMSSRRELYNQIRDAAGNERGANVTASNELNVLDSNSAAIKTAVETIDNAIAGSEMQVDVVGALPAGTNNIGDVDVASIAAGDNNIGNVDIVTLPGDVEADIDQIRDQIDLITPDIEEIRVAADSLNAKTPDEVGTWAYESATLTSGDLSATGACHGIRVYASGGDGTFNIEGGDTITVREDVGFEVNPKGNLVNPTVNWVSGTLDVFIEVLT